MPKWRKYISIKSELNNWVHGFHLEASEVSENVSTSVKWNTQDFIIHACTDQFLIDCGFLHFCVETVRIVKIDNSLKKTLICTLCVEYLLSL